MTVSLGHITFDCRDAVALAGFWAQALGRPVDDGAQPFFATIGYPATPERPAWLFLGVPEGKTAKNRMHLDLAADPESGGREAEVQRLVALGATKVAEQENSQPFAPT